ncbi:MAG: alpha/beta hydrolase [Thermodesulfobacteriota bacterium]|nr:alpha/beta hydrolase [Thermodesulfobacteriota bacterium]
MNDRRDIEFLSNGLTCAGWFYKTAEKEKAPCIILAHGFSAVKEMRLDAYAERFVEAGYNALVFDYRHFGGSEGMPRQLLDIKKQHQDWQAAIAFARTLPEVDASAIILWGSSFSGGHVLAIGATEPGIVAMISQVPHINGVATAMAAGIGHGARLGFAAFRDILRALFNRPPFYIPALGRPGELAAMTATGEYEASRKLFPRGSDINEDVAARIFFFMPLYSPGRHASKIKIPWLVQVAVNDRTTPPGPAIKAANAAPAGELITYPLGHFDVYVQPHFEQTIADQLAFLKKHTGN